MQGASRGRGGTPANPQYVKEQQYGSEIPAPRFGHTTTLVGNNRVVLFGGATGDSGRYTITADAFVLEADSNTWTRIRAEGANTPSARAAHAAACVDVSQMVIYGGATGGGSLSSEDLYLLDIRNEERSQWMAVPVEGPTPGRRYGHTMCFNKPLLIVFGGNNGQQAECDIWVLDVERSPFQWNEVQVIQSGNHARSPLPRVYHSAEVCREGPAAGMMVVFGGRTPDNRSLKDIWGLRQHRDGRWDWVEAPTKRGTPPEPRFQHSAIFLGSKLLIVGGRGADVARPLPTAVYDTESCEWRNVASVNRFRHACWGMGPLLFSYGGFDHRSPSAPTADLQVLDLDRAISASMATVAGVDEAEAEDGAGAARAMPDSVMNLQQGPSPAVASRAGVQEPPRPATPPRRPGAPTGVAARVERQIAHPGDPQISPNVYVAVEEDFTNHVREVAIQNLEDEGRRINQANAMANVGAEAANDGVASFVIQHLLQPTSWEPTDRFLLHAGEVSDLCDQAQEWFQAQDMVLSLRAPLKVYGDIHGQFLDLMRLFAKYGSPCHGENGDIATTDYLFLGDFVDRGSYSLETICLLFALKVRYPRQIHLIRGNHEDATINGIYGFKDECKRRLGEDPDDPNSCWNKFNKVFEYLPVGALIEDRILCLHGGIGGSIEKISQIKEMSRPLRVAQIPDNPYEQRVTDMLWSDPSDNDTVVGVSVNETRDPDGSGRIVKFGPDRVQEFLDANRPLSMIIRAHECVMDGFERFANGKLITVFSATDYCGSHKNAGALLFIRRDLTILPKLIYPMERSQNAWDQNMLRQRPPTPPRPVQRARRLGEDNGGDW
mmetsp:Transcript_85324/g.178299  ORF Transcript_85324/g.178299 Transcript_85324/m.178299 type:complete len:833 (+) Transcript_85324:123-2621(+)